MINAVIGERLERTLRASGFRKHARTFVRDAGVATQIVNVQASQWNEGDEGQFTLNVGVYFPAVARRRGIVASGAYPKEYDSTHRERIGFLMPDRQDHWWCVTANSDLAEIAAAVDESYCRFGAPWLESMLDLSVVLEVLVRRGESLMAAAVALELNRPDEAATIIADAYGHARPAFAPTVRRFAERNGIVLPAA